MHPFQRLKIMCLAAAEVLDKKGNMSLIKISFISLLIKRPSLVIEFLRPSLLGNPVLLFCSFLLSSVAADV
jgi:hypothetical protein